MTMTDNTCDVCHINPPIGVASTLIPYSCAYCYECADRFAQPECVFETIFDEVGTDVGKLAQGIAELETFVVDLTATVDGLETFAGGKYVSYREWAVMRSNRQ